MQIVSAGRGVKSLIVLTAAIALSVVACSSSPNGSSAAGTSAPSSGSAAPTPRYTIGISNPTGSSVATTLTTNAVKAADARMGIKVISLDAELNPQKQVSDINQFIAEKVNGIIVYPLSPGTLDPVLQRARAAGIKVLGWNAIVQRPAAGASIAPYNADVDNGVNYSGATQLANFVASKLHDSGSVVGIGIGTPVPSIVFQMQQYQALLASMAPKIKWLETTAEPASNVGIAGSEQAAATALTKYHNAVNAVITYNDDAGIGAYEALKAAGVTNAFVASSGGESAGISALKAGELSAVVDEVPWRQGLIMANMMEMMLTGKTVPNWVESSDVLYTKSNVSSRLGWNAALAEISSGALTCSNGGCPAPLNGNG